MAAQTATADCNGKAFYCTSATEFVHCIESSPGIFTADNVITGCPVNTICDNSVGLECSGVAAPAEPQVVPGEDLKWGLVPSDLILM